MATVITTCSVAYAAPEATIVMTWPVGLQEVDNINSIETEWSQDVNVNYDLELTLTSVNRDVTVKGHFLNSGMGASSYVNIQLDEQVTEPGRYVLTIPEGALFDGATYDASLATNETTSIYYLIEESQGDDPGAHTTFTLKEATPANGATVKDLSVIKLLWSGPIDSGFGATVSVNKDNEEVATAMIDYDAEDMFADDKVQLTIDPKITAEGTYTIVLPAGILSNSDNNSDSEETVLTYTIGEGGGNTPGDDSNVTYDFNPIDVAPENGSTIDDSIDMGMGGLETINIYFSAPAYVKEGFEFVFTNEEGTEFKSSKPSLEKDDETVNYYIFNLEGHSIILGLENIPTGTYTLTVPKGVIGNKAWADSGYTAGSSNEEFTYTWNYIAQTVVEVPKDVQDAPLELTVATVKLPNGDVVNLLDGDPGLASLPVGAEFTFATNKDEYAQSLVLDLVDNHNGESLWTIWTLPSKDPEIPSIGIKGEDGLFHFVKGGFDIPMYSNVKYTLSVSAYVNYEVPDNQKVFLQKTEVEIKGLTAALEYSDVEILGVTPEVSTVFDNPDQRSFTVTYSAPVIIDEAQSGYVMAYMGTQPFENVVSNDDKTEWTFTLPESELYECMGGDIPCNVVANDMDGRRVFPKYDGAEYNIDSYGDGYQQFVFNSYLGCPEVTVAPGAGIVKELYTFEFTCPEADKESIAMQGIDKDGNPINIVVVDAEGNEVAVMDRNNIVQINSKGQEVTDDLEDFESAVTKLIMHLDNAVTEAGEYTLIIPAQYFMVGTEFQAFANRPQEIAYTIDPTTGVAAVAGEAANVAVVDGKIVVAGAEGSVEVYAVNGAKVASVAAQDGNAVVALEKGVYVVVVNGNSVKVVL